MTNSTLWQRLTSEDNLYAGWLKVAGNMVAGGVDKVTIEDFELNLHDNLGVIKSLLEKGNYAFLPLLKFETNKSSGDGKRILGIPAIRDRIVQQAMVNLLQPVFEPAFLDCSYAYRPRRSAHQALARVERYIKEGCCWVFDGDIKSFFDTVNHSLLLDLIAKKLKREMERMSKRIQDVDGSLNTLLNEKGADSIPTELGLLRRIKRENKNSWVIEI